MLQHGCHSPGATAACMRTLLVHPHHLRPWLHPMAPSHGPIPWLHPMAPSLMVPSMVANAHAPRLHNPQLLWRYSRESVLLRIMFLGNSRSTGASHTVLVGHIHCVARHER